MPNLLIRHYTPGGFREKGEVVLVLKEESEERGGVAKRWNEYVTKKNYTLFCKKYDLKTIAPTTHAHRCFLYHIIQ